TALTSQPCGTIRSSTYSVSVLAIVFLPFGCGTRRAGRRVWLLRAVVGRRPMIALVSTISGVRGASSPSTVPRSVFLSCLEGGHGGFVERKDRMAFLSTDRLGPVAPAF